MFLTVLAVFQYLAAFHVLATFPSFSPSSHFLTYLFSVLIYIFVEQNCPLAYSRHPSQALLRSVLHVWYVKDALHQPNGPQSSVLMPEKKLLEMEVAHLAQDMSMD